MKTKCAVLAMAALVAGFITGRMCHADRHTLTVEKWTDTVVIRQPEVMVIRSLPPDTAMMAVVGDTSQGDSVPSPDSILVSIPREQHRYGGPGYSAWVSGYRPSLDSIIIERQTIVARPARRRWSVGLQAGVGMTPRGIQPYVGIGVSFRLY